MKKFNPAISLLKDSNGNYTDVEYTFFAPGDRYKQKAVTQTQVNDYTNGDLPGIKVLVELEKVGSGSPLSFAGSFVLDVNLELSAQKPFLDIGIYVYDPGTGQMVRKGGGVVRHADSDM